MKTLSTTSLKKLLNLIKTNFFQKSEAETVYTVDTEEVETIDTVEAATIAVDSTPTSSSNNLVTSGGVKAALDTKYALPVNGIPKSDLSSGVQNSLNLADSAIQSHQSLAAYRTSANQDLIDAGKEAISNKVTSLSAQSTDTQYPSAKAVFDALEAIPKGYESVLVDSTIATLGELAELIDDINTEGRHCFLDFHNHISGAYVCLVQKYTVNSTDYLYIFDLLNRHIYGSLLGYSTSTTISSYVSASANNNDLPYVLKITDANTTLADVIALIDKVNALGQHVFIDVSGLNTTDYLVTFTYNVGANVTSCKSIGLVKGVEAYRGYTTAQLSTTLFADFLATAGDLSSYFVGTYAEIKLLKDNGLLIPGAKYRLTDYAFRTSYPSVFGDLNHPFDLIITAASTTSFESDCSATKRAGDTYYAAGAEEKWCIKYQFENSTGRFRWAPTDGTAGATGVIYDMIDERGNHCSWDFKNCGVKKDYFTRYNLNCSGVNNSASLIYMFGGSQDYTMTSSNISFVVESNSFLVPFAIIGIITSGNFNVRYTGDWNGYYAGIGFVVNSGVVGVNLTLYQTFETVFESLYEVSGTAIGINYSTLRLSNVKFDSGSLYGSSAYITSCTITGNCNLNNTSTHPVHTSYNTCNVTISNTDFNAGNSTITLLPPSGFGFLSDHSGRNNISLISYGGSSMCALLQYFDNNKNLIVSKLLNETWPGGVYSFSISELYASTNPILTSGLGWNQTTRAGKLSPSIQLPAPIGTGCEEKLTYIFTAASSNATFTAPSGFILSDNSFTGLRDYGNTIPYSNLIENHIYIAKFEVISSNSISLDMVDWGVFSGPIVGDVINMNVDGSNKNYLIIGFEGSAAKVMGLQDIGTSAFDSSSVAYTNSSLNVYLNTTWYNSLAPSIQNIMQDITMENRNWYAQSGWDLDGRCGPDTHASPFDFDYYHMGRQPNTHVVETFHVRAPEIQELLSFMLNLKIMSAMRTQSSTVGDGGLYNYMIWRTFFSSETTTTGQFWLTNSHNINIPETVSDAWSIEAPNGKLASAAKSTVLGVRPVFAINLSQIQWTKV